MLKMLSVWAWLMLFSRYTFTFTSAFSCVISRLNSWRISSANPRRNSAMNAVEMAAKAIRPLRRIAVNVSRTNRETLGAIAVHPPRLVPDHRPVGELHDPPAHRVDDGVVMGGHHHRGPRAVDPVQELHDVDRRRRVQVPGGLVGQQDQRPVDERAGDGHALLLAAG